MRFNFLLLLLSVFLLVACATPRERAERLIKKANKIYPIDSLVAEKIIIDTLLQYDTVIIIDSVKTEVKVPIYDDKGNKIKYNNTVILDDNRAKITVSEIKDELVFDILIKQIQKQVTGTIPFKKQIITHRIFNTVTHTVKQKGIFYYMGIFFSGVLGAGVLFIGFKLYKRYKP